jgi:hypothetical protein
MGSFACLLLIHIYLALVEFEYEYIFFFLFSLFNPFFVDSVMLFGTFFPKFYITVRLLLLFDYYRLFTVIRKMDYCRQVPCQIQSFHILYISLILRFTNMYPKLFVVFPLVFYASIFIKLFRNRQLRIHRKGVSKKINAFYINLFSPSQIASIKQK